MGPGLGIYMHMVWVYLVSSINDSMCPKSKGSIVVNSMHKQLTLQSHRQPRPIVTIQGLSL